MANFKIQIPDEKLDFVLELFNNLPFLTYQSTSAEPQQEIQRIQTRRIKKTEEQKQADKINQLNSLRDTINSIQSSRSDIAPPKEYFLFRFPHGNEVGALRINSFNHLLSTIERYYRTNILGMRFDEITNPSSFDMDKFKVIITLSDQTELEAGYCNKNPKARPKQ